MVRRSCVFQRRPVGWGRTRRSAPADHRRDDQVRPQLSPQTSHGIPVPVQTKRGWRGQHCERVGAVRDCKASLRHGMECNGRPRRLRYEKGRPEGGPGSVEGAFTPSTQSSLRGLQMTRWRRQSSSDRPCLVDPSRDSILYGGKCLRLTRSQEGRVAAQRSRRPRSAAAAL